MNFINQIHLIYKNFIVFFLKKNKQILIKILVIFNNKNL